MLDLGTTATLSPWSYAPLRNLCSVTTIPAYLRDVDFAPDGNWFALVATGGIAPTGTVGTVIVAVVAIALAARFETWNLAPVRPTWINYTGGDTLHSVAATDKGVYVQGHQRWLDNPLGKDNAGPGAVSREGIGAINNSTGKALDWNPTKDRGIGGKDLLITARGLWVGSDTQRIGNELHARRALLP